MDSISFIEACNDLKAVLDRATEGANAIIISRPDADDAVVMSLDAYNSFIETLYLLSSPANAEHLNQSIEQYKRKEVFERDLIHE